MATPIPKNRAPFTLADLVAATGGEVVASGGDEGFVGVSTDSRAVTQGEVFVALAGERFDGHTHARAAVEQGARALVVSRDVEVPAGVAVLRVSDTLRALGALGRAHRRRWSASGVLPVSRPVVGITGSAGKTTTRHAVSKVLGALGARVHASVGNLNNAVGVPVTLLGLEPEHTAAVVEIGMNTPGEIAYAAGLAEPDVAVVTLVAEAHTEGVGSIWGVLREKSDLLAALGPAGIAIANGDDARARAGLLRSRAEQRLTYGASDGCVVRLLARAARGLAGQELVIEVALAGREPARIETSVPLLGKAGTYAALAAASVALALDPTLADSPDDLSRALASVGDNEGGRLAARERPDGTVVVDDAYNANPASMVASLEAASEIARALERRFVAVLGAMYELGERSVALHEEVGRRAAALGPAALVVVQKGDGPALARAAREAGVEVVEVPDAAAAEERAAALVAPRDVVLVKASNSVGLSRVAARLLAG